MLLGTLGASVLGNLLIGKGAIATNLGWSTIRAAEGTFRAGEGTVRAGFNFWCHLIFSQILECKFIIKMNLNLTVFIQEIIYIKYRMGHV